MRTCPEKWGRVVALRSVDMAAAIPPVGITENWRLSFNAVLLRVRHVSCLTCALMCGFWSSSSWLPLFCNLLRTLSHFCERYVTFCCPNVRAMIKDLCYQTQRVCGQDYAYTSRQPVFPFSAPLPLLKPRTFVSRAVSSLLWVYYTSVSQPLWDHGPVNSFL
jgi:hypothetical protein